MNFFYSQDEVSQMIISFLSIMANFERNMILQRQREGIEIAKIKGLYKWRVVNSKDSKANFIEKPRNQKISSYLEKEYPHSEICKIIGCSFSTITKVRTISREFGEKY